jgi:hypothetical protein
MKYNLRTIWNAMMYLVITSVLEQNFETKINHAKLTEEYLTQVAPFIQNVTINNFDDFPQRITALKKELENYKVVEPSQKTIGFTHNE